MAKTKTRTLVQEDEVVVNEAHNAPMEEAAPIVRKKGEAINGVKLKDASHASPMEENEAEIVKVKAKDPAHLKPQQ